MNKNNLSAQVTDKTTFTDVEMISQLIFWTCSGSLIYDGSQETFQWMFTHIAVVRDLVAMQYKEHQEVTCTSAMSNIYRKVK